MSIQFIMGRSAESCTSEIFKKALDLSDTIDEKSKIYIVVPEQFTLDAQRGIINAHKRHAILNIDVVSFNRLAYKVLSKIGDTDIPVMRDSGKNMIIRKILLENKDKLRFFTRATTFPGLVSELKSVVSELQQYDISYEQLENAAKSLKNEKKLRLYDKISDVTLIYQQFKNTLNTKFITQEELPNLLRYKLAQNSFFSGDIFLFDGFTGFTPIQYKLLEVIIRQASKVYLSVIYDSNCIIKKSDFNDAGVPSGGLYFMSRDFIDKVIQAGEVMQTEVSDPIICNQDVWRSDELLYLRDNLFYEQYSKQKKSLQLNDNDFLLKPPEDIIITESSDIQEEISNVARQIYYLTRYCDMRYRDIGVILGNIEIYADAVIKIFNKFRFNAFLDRRKNVRNNPYVENIRAFMQVMCGDYSYEAVFRFIKSGFTGLSESETDILDNYVYAVGIKSKNAWKNEWTRIPQKQKTDENGLLVPYYDLKILNLYRDKIYNIFDYYNSKFKKCKNANHMADVLLEYLESDEVKKRMSELTENSDYIASSEYSQIHNKIIEITDEIKLILGNVSKEYEKISIDEFSLILDAAFEEISVGFIPPDNDCIIVGDIERTRLQNIKALFVLGVNDGNIPTVQTDGGIFTQADRLKLKQNDLLLSPSVRDRAFIQRFYIYLLLTRPTHKLYLSYVIKNSVAEGLLPSYIIENLKQIFPALKIQTLSEKVKHENNTWLTPNSIYTLDWFTDTDISSGLASLLYGNEIKGSISSFEKFAGCEFSFLLSKGLGILKKEKYEFTTQDLGIIVHDVLKNIFDICIKKGELPENMSEDEIRFLIERSINNGGSRYLILNDSARDSYMRKRIYDMVKRTAITVSKQIRAGSFVPAYTEQDFKVEKSLSDGKRLIFHGIIDRIDMAKVKNDLYLRIIDYKTYNKDFELSEAYYGRQIQLIGYLSAAIDYFKKSKDIDSVIPAGVFYYNVSDPMVLINDEKKESPEELISKELRLGGLIADDENILMLTDKSKSGNVVNGLSFSNRMGISKNIISPKRLEALMKFEDEKIKKIACDILDGAASINPLISSDTNYISSCDYCDYSDICNFSKDLNKKYRSIEKHRDEDLWEMIMNEVGMDE